MSFFHCLSVLRSGRGFPRARLGLPRELAMPQKAKRRIGRLKKRRAAAPAPTREEEPEERPSQPQDMEVEGACDSE